MECVHKLVFCLLCSCLHDLLEWQIFTYLKYDIWNYTEFDLFNSTFLGLFDWEDILKRTVRYYIGFLFGFWLHL